MSKDDAWVLHPTAITDFDEAFPIDGPDIYPILTVIDILGIYPPIFQEWIDAGYFPEPKKQRYFFAEDLRAWWATREERWKAVSKDFLRAAIVKETDTKYAVFCPYCGKTHWHEKDDRSFWLPILRDPTCSVKWGIYLPPYELTYPTLKAKASAPPKHLNA
ncbi:protein of unknown function [Burkholderia multivorans]